MVSRHICEEPKFFHPQDLTPTIRLRLDDEWNSERHLRSSYHNRDRFLLLARSNTRLLPVLCKE